jgi:hypothetical protein
MSSAHLSPASKIICEWLWDNYSQMDCSAEKSEDWINPKIWAEEECQNWLEGVYEMPEGSDEMYPPWVTLVVTPAINNTIQWAEIKTILCDRHDFLAFEAEEEQTSLVTYTPPATSNIESALMSCLSDVPQNARTLLKAVQSIFPTANKSNINSLLYKMPLKKTVIQGVSAPLWSI